MQEASLTDSTKRTADINQQGGYAGCLFERQHQKDC